MLTPAWGRDLPTAGPRAPSSSETASEVVTCVGAAPRSEPGARGYFDDGIELNSPLSQHLVSVRLCSGSV